MEGWVDLGYEATQRTGVKLLTPWSQVQHTNPLHHRDTDSNESDDARCTNLVFQRKESLPAQTQSK